MGKRRGSGDAQPFWWEERACWAQWVELPLSDDGKRKRKRVTGPTKTAVRDGVRRVLVELDTTGVAERSVTVRRLAEEYLASIEGEVAPRSHASYESWLRVHVLPALGKHQAKRLTPAHVAAWHRSMTKAGKSTNTRAAAHRVLRQTLSYGERVGYLHRNAARISGGPKGPRTKVVPLTPAEVAVLLGAVEGWRHEAAVWVMAGCGLRISETLGLRWGYVNLEGRRLQVAAQLQRVPGEGLVVVERTKTAGSARTVIIPERVGAVLARHRADQIAERERFGVRAELRPGDLVFTNTTLRAVDHSNLGRELAKLAHDAGIEKRVHPHKLRHTAVSLLIDQEVPLELVSEAAGHSNIGTTKDIYGTLYDTARHRIADAMDQALTVVPDARGA